MVMGEKWYLQTYEVPTKSFIIEVGFVSVFFSPETRETRAVRCPIKKTKAHTQHFTKPQKK